MELLSPAGDLLKLKTAFRYGADAAYIGLDAFSLRNRSASLGVSDKEELLALKQAFPGKKVYAAANKFFFDDDLKLFEERIEEFSDLPVDALIVSDAGLYRLVRRKWPGISLHLSTQANTLNSEAAAFYRDLGFSRVILGRELPLSAIEKLRAKVSDLELEVFVHGALCLAYSGRCYLSAAMAGRSANGGSCAHSCRWEYRLLSKGKDYYLEEKQRPGQLFRLEEELGYTGILSSKDLCMFDHLGELKAAGVASVKIEGRMKSEYYVASVTRAYRKALDSLRAGFRPAGEQADLTPYRDDLDGVSHREYSRGFYFDADEIQAPARRGYEARFQYLGIVRTELPPDPTRLDGKKSWFRYKIDVKNKFGKGEVLEIISPDFHSQNLADYFFVDREGNAVSEAEPGKTEDIYSSRELGPEWIFRRRIVQEKKETLVSNQKEKTIESQNFEELGLRVPEVLLPAKDIDLGRWAVVACDQYTSDQGYWNSVDGLVGERPSTLRLTLPEIYLESPDVQKRVDDIHLTMDRYLKEGVLKAQEPGFVYVERTTAPSGLRQGLLVAFDLERYDFSPDSTSLIRATEGTIVDRIPPRLRVRKAAALELPHIMILVDDEEKKLLEPLAETARRHKFDQVYDIDLMKQGGSLRGWLIKDGATLEKIKEALLELYRKSAEKQKSSTPLFFAMGDGNHSLATAKAHWENLKKELAEKGLSAAEINKHPARFALAELVNVHSEGLRFEPIHRVLFSKNKKELLAFIKSHGSVSSCLPVGEEELKERLKGSGGRFEAGLCDGEGFYLLEFEAPDSQLPPARADRFYQDYRNLNPEAKIDFIHGWEECTELGATEGAGILLPVIGRTELFSWVQKHGPLPRKSFSMGEAEEKRYYVEARLIVPGN